MKKNIIIGTLTILLVASISYGYYQKKRADRIENELTQQLLMKAEMVKISKEAMENARQKFENKTLKVTK
jgi:Mg2+/citrate symporter